jgi:hypothetical protein
MLLKVLVGSVPVVAILVGAAFVLPPSVPVLLRQVVLCLIGVGGIIVAERRLFGKGWRRIVATLGFVAPAPRAVVVAIVDLLLARLSHSIPTGSRFFSA